MQGLSSARLGWWQKPFAREVGPQAVGTGCPVLTGAFQQSLHNGSKVYIIFNAPH